MSIINCPVCGMPIDTTWESDNCPNCGLDSALAENFYGAKAYTIWNAVVDYRLSRQQQTAGYVPVKTPKLQKDIVQNPRIRPGRPVPTRPIFENKKTNSEPIKTKYIPGNIITIGTKKGERLNWSVLSVKSDRLLVIAETPLFVNSRYHVGKVDTTWENSSIRRTLNGEVYLNLFNDSEKEKIIPSMVVSGDNKRFGISGGDKTLDRLFLLSVEEVNRYLDNKKIKVCRYLGDSVSWWLRTPGHDYKSAAYVDEFGMVNYEGTSVSSPENAIRPAMWIRV